MNIRQHLGIFTKTPILGRCKTRLIPLLGAEAATAAHCELVQRALSEVSVATNIQASLWVTEIESQTQQWAESWQLSLALQEGADLGERMFNCLDHLCSAAGQGAMLMGTDCPDVDARYINAAGQSLRDYDLVLGPAEDGGYGLIGMRQAHKALFQAIDWGTDAVAEQTLVAASKLELSVFEMPKIWDVDRPEDWQRYLLLKAQEAEETAIKRS